MLQWPGFDRGDYVKVEFDSEVQGLPGEWMWARVHHCDEERQVVFGTLDNEPVLNSEDLQLGQELAIDYGKVREGAWGTTLSPATDFINARPRGDTQLMWLRLRSTSSVPTMLTPLAPLPRHWHSARSLRKMPSSPPAPLWELSGPPLPRLRFAS